MLNDSTRDRVGFEEGNAPTPARIAVSDDQREIWLASQLSSDAAATYHESYVVQIEGVLDQALLASAIQEVVNRHDALRITFASDGSTQVIASRREQVLDVEELDARASEEDVEGRIRERILEPFDFETGPLFRSILFTQGPERFLLLLVVHHIIADGWSLAVLLDEVSTVYTEAQAGVTSSLKPALQYRDYVSWLTHDETKAQETAARDYWLEAFRNPLSVVELPSDHPRPAVKTFAAGHRRESLGEEFYAKVKRASQEYECTVFQLMLAGMMALLFRLTGQSDVVVGIPHAGQLSSGLGDLEGTDSLVGHCASLLPICARPRGEQTFGDLVREVKERLLEARNHQQFTYSKVSEQLKMSRDSSRVPLVSVSLNLVRVHHAKLGDLATQVTVPPKAFNFFDVTIDLLQGDRDLSLDAKYNSDLYEHSSVVRWLSQWRRVLEQALESSDQPLSQLTLLTERERGLMLEEWNATEREYLRDGVLHSLFERTADRDPSGTALVFGERSLTYLELEQRANRIAHQLREMGARPGRLVGVCLERSPDMVATLLAVLKSGAAYVPLDPAYPPDRIAYVLDNADATILVTQATVVSSLEKIPCQVLSLDDDAESIEGQPVSRPDPLAGPEELAYVIYTSGSTGRPKGVQIEHRAAVNFVQAMAERPGLGRDDVLLAVTTVSFDIAVLELFLPMYAGATVVLASRVTAHDPEALQHALRQHGVTVMQATPATWSMLIETGWTGSPGLRVLCGGEALSADLAEQLLPRCAELWNMYGPTETTVWSSCCKIEEPANIHIGTPIANTQLYILDDALQPRPIGAAGELMIGGDGVARGYLGQPTLTAQKFIASPFREGQPIYRTGDLAKFRDDGSIECLGRVDFQVKIRGLRVELGEIESVLTAQAGIEQAVAVAREDRPGDKRLVAYVRTAEGAPFGETELRQAVKATLPDYMVPTRVVALDAFPLTPNGKVDRQALPKPQNAAPQKNGEDERPRGEIEVGLERLLKTILQLPSVGRHDNFFDAGGHSLLAVKYFNEIHRAYGIRLPLSTLLRAGSIAELAAEIGNRRQSNHGPRSLVEIQSEGTKPTFFCVHGAGGNVLFYRDLSRTLGAEFPFYGLQSRGSDGSSEPLSSIEEMAKTYVKEVKTVQASGPYHLGGYCLGGLIAYEMARQLEDSDDEVALLALLDSYNLSRMEPVGTPRNLTEKAYFHLRNLLHAPYSTWRSYMAQKIRTARDGELSLIANSIFRRRRATEDSLQGRIHRLNVAAAMRYQPRPYRGVVTNLKPTRNYSAFPDPDMGWSGLALEGVTNINLDLNPHAMLAEPFVAQTAAALSRLLSTPERRLRVVDRRSA